MKANKLKLITIMLLVILIIMVGFFGVYSRENGRMKNTVKDYKYAMDIEGVKVATIELATGTKEIIKDKDGNIVNGATDEEIEKNGYTRVEEPINKEENKTQDNYNLTKEVIKNRFDKLGVTGYVIRLDEESGKIVLELPDNDNLNNILEIVTTVGKFEIVDADTKEVLINNDDISTSNVYRNTTAYGTEMSFSIEFNGEGKKKFEDITKKYVTVNKEEENKVAENNENSSTETTENKEEQKTEETEKKVALKLDDIELMSTSFEKPVTDGKMYLTVGQTATTPEQVKNNYAQAQKMAALLSTKPMPLSYKQNNNTFVQSELKENTTKTMMIGIAIVIAIVTVFLFIKYKTKGLLTAICFAGFAAILLLTVRYWNVELSGESIVAIFGIFVLNFVLVNKILSNLNKEKDNKKAETKHVINMAIKDFTFKIIPLFIIAVVFVFATWTSTSSFGMGLFWGLTLIELYNLFITKYVLKYLNK